MYQVETIKGLIDRDRLEVREIVTETDHARCIATEWTLDGELVRRDAHVMILRTEPIGGEQVRM